MSSSAPRARSTRSAEALAASSPSSSIRSWRASARVTGTSTASATATGRTWSQPRPLRLPVSHTVARCASKISARVSRYDVIELTAPRSRRCRRAPGGSRSTPRL